MFYSQLILARKGPLGKVWLAAHWDKKLTKLSILSTDISESVENILDPNTPLALRVSGHLMLGVVRIYARKVKYLMADVTEVMWKVKMAYKLNTANTVDMVETAGNAAIDDPRFFGNAPIDFDYPELAETAFSQNMLTQYNELKAARGRTLNSQYMQSQDVSSSVQDSRTKSAKKRSLDTINEDEISVAGSSVSRISEIELMRGEKSRSTLHSVARSSLSSAGLKFIEDELPAYVEDPDLFPAYDSTAYVPEYAAEYPAAMEYEPVVAAAPALSPVQQPQDESSLFSSEHAPEEEPAVPAVVRRRAGKRRRPVVVLDERVELPSRVIKEQLGDRSPILRRHPGDALPPRPSASDLLTAEQLLSMPSARDLCPELLELFQMTMTMGALPFPLLDHQEDDEELSEAEELEMTRFQHNRSDARASFLDNEDVQQRHSQDSSMKEDMQGQELPPYEMAPYEEMYPEQQQSFVPDYEPLPESPVSRRTTGPSALDGLDADSAGQEGISVPADVASIEACSARTAKVLEVLKGKFKEQEALRFSELSAGASRRNAAGCFFEVLQLHTWGLLSAEQPEPFADLTLRATEKMWAVA